MEKIIIKGARENNLKNVSLELPKNKFIVMTGVSGSGKSSLAFDTIYKEGERRYLESLSAYARQFLGGTEKPDVDSIEGLSPAISIDQKTTNKNPRSTVGTVTELYDHLRLLFAKAGTPYCPNHNIPITNQSIEEMTNKVIDMEEGTKIIISSPVIEGKKGTHKDLLEDLRKSGYVRVKIDDKDYDLEEDIDLEKNKKHNIEVVIDRLVIKDEVRSRLYESLETAAKLSKGKVFVDVLGKEKLVFSENFSCPHCNFSLTELEPRTFSFNAPYGACSDCKGLGVKLVMDIDLVIPDRNKTIAEGGIVPFGDDPENINYLKLENFCEHYGIDLNKKIKDFTKKELDMILYGTDDIIHYHFRSKNGRLSDSYGTFEGIITNLERRYMETTSTWIREWLERYMVELECPTCKGARLKEEVLSVKINNKNIYEVTEMSIKNLYDFMQNLKLSEEKKEISKMIVQEISNRLSFLINVGLDYLTLARSAGTLSGGEAQRIRLATQVGTRLTGVLYVLDEPSIGLHQRDNDRLIQTMKSMRDLGNTLIVVEHDMDTMRQCDFLVDVGPEAGEKGGEIVSMGTPEEVASDEKSITGRYLSGKECIEIPKTRRKGNKKYIEIKGAQENNLKNINVKFPLGTFTCVTGVSGSGKSTLVNQILTRILYQTVYNSKEKPGKYESVKGTENIDKIVHISQSPIGRTPRSNPATYVGVFDDIREVLGIKSSDGSTVHFDVRQDSRISGRHRRDNTIDLIGYRVVVGFDGNDSRSSHSTGLHEDGLLGVHLLIRNRQRTRTERHLHIEIALVFVFQTQILVQLIDMNCRKEVTRLEDRALE